MVKTTLEAYGKVAGITGSYTELAGRYPVQQAAEALIPADVVAKLQLNTQDRLLEVGCGAGNLLLPLSTRVASAVGIDHANLVDKLQARADTQAIRAIAGDFMDVTLPPEFDKVLVYSVLHCLPDMQAVLRFVDKVLALLPSGGAALFGDIPNDDLKARFLASAAGRAFEIEWRALMAQQDVEPSAVHAELVDSVSGLSHARFDDASLLSLITRCRQQGYNAYWLAQPPTLPFGHTREDVLVTRP